jgi:hypothetical protein
VMSVPTNHQTWNGTNTMAPPADQNAPVIMSERARRDHLRRARRSSPTGGCTRLG